MRNVFVFAVAMAAIPIMLCAQEVPDDFSVTLERGGTSCGEPTRTYSVTINARGDVAYRGMRFVRVEGAVADHIPVSRVRALLSTVARIKFFELRDRYDTLPAGDGTYVIVTHRQMSCVSVTRDGQTKRIEESLGSPEGLLALERQIDDTVRTQRWLRIDVDTLRMMVESGHAPPADTRQVWLREALLADEVDVIQALLDIGADPNGTSPGDDYHPPARPLVIVRSAAAARALIDAGADAAAPDEVGQTPMKTATELPPEVAEVLLKTGVPLEVPVDHVGDTALVRAASLGNIGVVRLLLAAGANPFYRAENGTALDQARQSKAFQQRRKPLPVEIERAPFVRDFDGVIAALERALARRR